MQNSTYFLFHHMVFTKYTHAHKKNVIKAQYAQRCISKVDMQEMLKREGLCPQSFIIDVMLPVKEGTGS